MTQVPGTAVGRPPVTGATSSCVARSPPSPVLPKLIWSARNLPSGLKAPLVTELPAGTATTVCLPVARSSIWTLHAGVHVDVQAISLGLAASTRSNTWRAWEADGFHSTATSAPGCWLTGASSRPRSVPWSIAYPDGSRTGRVGAPVASASRAVPATVVMLTPSG